MLIFDMLIYQLILICSLIFTTYLPSHELLMLKMPIYFFELET